MKKRKIKITKHKSSLYLMTLCSLIYLYIYTVLILYKSSTEIKKKNKIKN